MIRVVCSSWESASGEAQHRVCAHILPGRFESCVHTQYLATARTATCYHTTSFLLPSCKNALFTFLAFFFFCLTSRPSHSLPSLSARPPTGPSADSAARPHSVGSGQAPRGMKSSSQIELKAWEMRKGPQYVAAQKPVSLNRSCCENYNVAWMVELTVTLWLALFFPASVVCLLLSSRAAGRGDRRGRWGGRRSHAD